MSRQLKDHLQAQLRWQYSQYFQWGQTNWYLVSFCLDLEFRFQSFDRTMYLDNGWKRKADCESFKRTNENNEAVLSHTFTRNPMQARIRDDKDILDVMLLKCLPMIYKIYWNRNYQFAPNMQWFRERTRDRSREKCSLHKCGSSSSLLILRLEDVRNVECRKISADFNLPQLWVIVIFAICNHEFFMEAIFRKFTDICKTILSSFRQINLNNIQVSPLSVWGK